MSLKPEKGAPGDSSTHQDDQRDESNGIYPHFLMKHYHVPAEEQSATSRRSSEELPNGHNIETSSANGFEAVDQSRPSMTMVNMLPRAIPWTSAEEELLLHIYKEYAGQLRRKGKRGQTLWQFITETLNTRCTEIGIERDTRCVQKVKDKFFNLSKKYKMLKNRKSETGLDFSVAHLQIFSEFGKSKYPLSFEAESEYYPSERCVTGTKDLEHYPSERCVTGTKNPEHYPSERFVTGTKDTEHYLSERCVTGTKDPKNCPSERYVTGNKDLERYPSDRCVTSNKDLERYPSQHCVTDANDPEHCPSEPCATEARESTHLRADSPPKFVFDDYENATRRDTHGINDNIVLVSSRPGSRTEESESAGELEQMEVVTVDVPTAKRQRVEYTEYAGNHLGRMTSETEEARHSPRKRYKRVDMVEKRGVSSYDERLLALLEKQTELMQQSQRREEELIKVIQQSDRNFSELFVGAIKELGSLLKKTD